jgi:HlyD family secretion protein
MTTLPAGLVLVREGKAGVMVNDGGKAKWREVTVGLRGRESVEVTAGLKSGDVVVSPANANSEMVREGRRIRPK